MRCTETLTLGKMRLYTYHKMSATLLLHIAISLFEAL